MSAMRNDGNERLAADDAGGSDAEEAERQWLLRANAALVQENASLRRRLDEATAARHRDSVEGSGDYATSSSSSRRHYDRRRSSEDSGQSGTDEAHDKDDGNDGDEVGASELMRESACVEVIRKYESDATVLTLYDELLRLRKQCTLYAEAMAETRSYFDEMQRLYSELESHLKGTGGSSNSSDDGGGGGSGSAALDGTPTAP